MSDPQTDSQRLSQNSRADPRTRSHYWIDDGNIVLQAESTLFRVHRSILSRHSHVFSDMFAIAHAPSEEHIEDCPVITLSDSAEDVGNIISLLYDNEKAFQFASKLPVRVLGSMLRLGRKYAIAHLETEALGALQNDYERNLADNHRELRIESMPDTPTEVIRIAYEFGLFSILPAAYINFFKGKSFVASFSCKNPIVSDYCIEQISILTDPRLPVQALEHCAWGLVRLSDWSMEKRQEAYGMFSSRGCITDGGCYEQTWQSFNNLTKEEWAIGMFHMLNTSEHEAKKGLLEFPTCSRCRRATENWTNNVWAECWSSLPAFFKLSAWSDLEDMI